MNRILFHGDILKNHVDTFVASPDWVAARGMRMLAAPVERRSAGDIRGVRRRAVRNTCLHHDNGRVPAAERASRTGREFESTPLLHRR